MADGTRWPCSGQPVMALEGGGKTLTMRSITRSGETLDAEFEDGTRARFRVTERPGLVLLRLESLVAHADRAAAAVPARRSCQGEAGRHPERGLYRPLGRGGDGGHAERRGPVGDRRLLPRRSGRLAHRFVQTDQARPAASPPSSRPPATRPPAVGACGASRSPGRST